MTTPPTILVFDSGLGGLTVLREIVAMRPDADVVYVADDAFFPYGGHPEEKVVARVVPLVGELIARHRPDIVVIACNTISTVALPQLRAAHSVPFVGTVPGIKPACAMSQTRRVSVLGTKGTVAREYTQKLIADFSDGCEVTLVGSGRLAPLAEAAMRGEAVDDDAIAAEIAGCFMDGVARTDTVVLACTHFPLLTRGRARLARGPAPGLDPARAFARRVADLVGAPGGSSPGAPPRMIFSSGAEASPDLVRAIDPFFGGRLAGACNPL